MAITTTQLYITTDGKEFKSEMDARGHDTALKISSVVEGYIAEAGMKHKKAQAGLLRKHLPAFIGWMSQFGDTAESAAANFSALMANVQTTSEDASKDTPEDTPEDASEDASDEVTSE